MTPEGRGELPGARIVVMRNPDGSLTYNWKSTLSNAEMVLALEAMKLKLMGVGYKTTIPGLNPRELP